MKKTAILFVAAAMIGCNNAGNEAAKTTKADSPAVAAAPAKTETPAPPPMDSATQMKKWKEYMAPGDMHKMLASSEGKWTTEVTMYDEDAKKPPQKSTGTCENKAILGGRFLQSWHKGSAMGMPFEGMGTMGYDNYKKVFVSSWQDNMGTGIMNLEGPYDAATKTITLKGQWDDPIKGKMEMKETWKIIDDKNQLMEMYGIVAGKETKWMEMKFAKK
jgi:hypothetical protein